MPDKSVSRERGRAPADPVRRHGLLPGRAADPVRWSGLLPGRALSDPGRRPGLLPGRAADPVRRPGLLPGQPAPGPQLLGDRQGRPPQHRQQEWENMLFSVLEKKSVLRIRICMILGLPDPNPLVPTTYRTDPDPAPDPSIIKQK